VKQSEIRKASVKTLLEHYAAAAREYRHLAAERDYPGSAQQQSLLEEIYQELKTRGRNSQEHLLILLDHDDPAVRRWAAAHALGFAPGLAKPVLEKLARGPGLLSLDAQIALRGWRENQGRTR
jgi:hypothetical protein